ncbi:hypothetical protein F6X40_11505, partial [Paraburkholderia sp. UCT31]|nr:hypothetical protein [Paraburkholderia sp. UCT31]
MNRSKLALVLSLLCPLAAGAAPSYSFRVVVKGLTGPVAPVAPPSATFSPITMTSCGATGQSGPTPGQCTSTYGASAPAGFSVQNGIQQWTVPVSGQYVITAAGAQGGATSGFSGGRGNVVRGTFALTQGQVVRVLVGQRGLTGSQDYWNGDSWGSGGGGGGTFVQINGTLALAAGGGGGAESYYNSISRNWSQSATGQDASTTTSGGTEFVGGAAGTNGNGGGGGN